MTPGRQNSTRKWESGNHRGSGSALHEPPAAGHRAGAGRGRPRGGGDRGGGRQCRSGRLLGGGGRGGISHGRAAGDGCAVGVGIGRCHLGSEGLNDLGKHTAVRGCNQTQDAASEPRIHIHMRSHRQDTVSVWFLLGVFCSETCRAPFPTIRFRCKQSFRQRNCWWHMLIGLSGIMA